MKVIVAVLENICRPYGCVGIVIVVLVVVKIVNQILEIQKEFRKNTIVVRETPCHPTLCSSSLWAHKKNQFESNRIESS